MRPCKAFALGQARTHYKDRSKQPPLRSVHVEKFLQLETCDLRALFRTRITASTLLKQ